MWRGMRSLDVCSWRLCRRSEARTNPRRRWLHLGEEMRGQRIFFFPTDGFDYNFPCLLDSGTGEPDTKECNTGPLNQINILDRRPVLFQDLGLIFLQLSSFSSQRRPLAPPCCARFPLRPRPSRLRTVPVGPSNRHFRKHFAVPPHVPFPSFR